MTGPDGDLLAAHGARAGARAELTVWFWLRRFLPQRTPGEVLPNRQRSRPLDIASTGAREGQR
jgi:hypothetical protein